ncbi:MAG: hypothetical protein L0220_13295 [Acidobacteria bacterium]|nr:hypothetical protein [Acidobacteriota bacterium]
MVIVKGDKVLAVGHRGEEGPGNHAEYGTLEKKLKDVAVAGATVFTTLEPCTTRKHPKVPCAERLIERKVSRVVIGMLDPNPDIRGKGQIRLREANIAIETFADDLTAEIEEMNRDFILQHKSVTPSSNKATETSQLAYVDYADYYTVAEVAQKLGVDESRVFQWGITGKLIFAFIRHSPSNFQEEWEKKDEHGRDVKVTRTHQSITFTSKGAASGPEILYIRPNDAAAIILNNTPGRKIGVSALFYTSELLPQKGIAFSSPVLVEKAELIVTKEEFQRFIALNNPSTNSQNK